jgi:wobble nucleotide-excising tRNase
MINSIVLKGVATYDSVEGITVDNLGKINFIYGSNGCGKTTISNFLQESIDSKYSHCEITWHHGRELKTLVYNKEFRKKNFGLGKLNGVFTLGQATADDIKVLDEKKALLKEKQEEINKRKDVYNTQVSKKEELLNKFKETCWANIFKKYETNFRYAFQGSLTKEGFKSKLLEEFNNNNFPLLSIEELKEKALIVLGDEPQLIQYINDINYERIIEIESNPIWNKAIVGKEDVNIARLIQKLNINDWVNEGTNYLQEDSNICPFCQKETITQDFKEQLESFFDETFIRELDLIKRLRSEYDLLINNIFNELQGIEESQINFKETKLDLGRFSACLKTFHSQCIANNEFLNQKIKETSRRIELIGLKDQLDEIVSLIREANIKSKEHNDIVNNFQAEKTKLIKSIWKYIINEFQSNIQDYIKNVESLDKSITGLDSQISYNVAIVDNLKKDIIHLSKNVTSIQPTIDEINRLLSSYGFTNFRIVPAIDNGFYQIRREDGEIAEHTLSEGEVTFITFLYYLQLTKGGYDESSVNEERILVIDDPISSLDSNVLFIVSTLIKEILKNVRSSIGNIKQVILLTHNIYFHKEASYEGSNRPKGETNQYYILRKIGNKTSIYSYKDKNPISSSYELLWNEIKEYEKNSGITVQNAMRRVIENYFSILGSKRDDTLLSKFENPQEKEIFRSLLSWVNEGSHTLPDDLYVEMPDQSINTYLKVFREVFLHTNNLGHYNMMMGIDESDVA